MNKIKGNFLVVLLLLLSACVSLSAQNQALFGIEYTTEIQTDFGKKSNWVNLLLLDVEKKVGERGMLKVQTISTYKPVEERIVSDLQTFSNIEEENRWLNVFLAGYTQIFEKGLLFVGVRNVNYDYFTSDYTSLFTNSSNGIHPTLSLNFPVANYPLSAMCLHGELQLSDKIKLKNSLYNGVAGKLTDRFACFSVHPRRDGFLNVTKISYTPAGSKQGFYNVGFAWQSSPFNYAVWGCAEQALWQSEKKKIGLLLQASFAPFQSNDCRRFFSLGALFEGFIFSKKAEQWGIVLNQAVCRAATETAIEITWRCELNPHWTVQPVLNFIATGDQRYAVGLVRFNYAFRSGNAR